MLRHFCCGAFGATALWLGKTGGFVFRLRSSSLLHMVYTIDLYPSLWRRAIAENVSYPSSSTQLAIFFYHVDVTSVNLRHCVFDQCQVVIQAAYGSTKDISVYTSIGLHPQQIYIVCKNPTKKYEKQAQVGHISSQFIYIVHIYIYIYASHFWILELVSMSVRSTDLFQWPR